jgi:hypothetical protein
LIQQHSNKPAGRATKALGGTIWHMSTTTKIGCLIGSLFLLVLGFFKPEGEVLRMIIDSAGVCGVVLFAIMYLRVSREDSEVRR